MRSLSRSQATIVRSDWYRSTTFRQNANAGPIRPRLDYFLGRPQASPIRVIQVHRNQSAPNGIEPQEPGIGEPD
jgi:hypothetical protein